MHLYLVRHGQTFNNAGLDDKIESPLTNLGEEQADLAGRWLSDMEFHALYCSPMLRALQTADALARHIQLSPQARAHLCEHRPDTGYTGLPRSEIVRLFPNCALPEDVTEEGWWSAPLEDETTLYRRAGEAARTIRSTHGDSADRVAVITHGIFGSALISALLDLPPAGYKRFNLFNTAITLFSIRSGQTRMEMHNFTGHLPPDKIT